MTNQHPITPPPELVQQWWEEADQYQRSGDNTKTYFDYVATRAAQWGANQELEECCEVLARELICDGKHVATDLRKIRRPKPPSLKQQALSLIDNCTDPEGDYLDDNALSIIRRALEALLDE